MPKRKEYSVELKEAVVNTVRQGNSQSAVAKQFGLSQQLVSVWCKKKKLTGSLNNKPRSGRPRKTTERIDRIIRKRSVADPRKAATTIRNDLEETFGCKLHVSTVKRRLAAVGLNDRRPSKKPMISAKN